MNLEKLIEGIDIEHLAISIQHSAPRRQPPVPRTQHPDARTQPPKPRTLILNSQLISSIVLIIFVF